MDGSAGAMAKGLKMCDMYDVRECEWWLVGTSADLLGVTLRSP